MSARDVFAMGGGRGSVVRGRDAAGRRSQQSRAVGGRNYARFGVQPRSHPTGGGRLTLKCESMATRYAAPMVGVDVDVLGDRFTLTTVRAGRPAA